RMSLTPPRTSIPRATHTSSASASAPTDSPSDSALGAVPPDIGAPHPFPSQKEDHHEEYDHALRLHYGSDGRRPPRDDQLRIIGRRLHRRKRSVRHGPARGHRYHQRAD